MTALIRFHLSGYVRSLRVLQPVLAVFLLVSVVLVNGPAGLDRATTMKLHMGGYADVAAFLFTIWAWAARGVLDTEPDRQRELCALAVGRRTAMAAGLLAAYVVNLGLAGIALAVPVGQGISAGVSGGTLPAAVALHLVVAVPATLVGALTSRAVLPSTAVSILALLGGCLVLLILSMGPLAWLSVPMIGWLRAAHDGPAALTAALPGLAAHIAAWSAVAAAGYAWARRART
ncbi:hypothetical protein [Actinomadura sp. HBU206391]|uniref:hypothetical protein n=1 Tax=Actinomadura sp. HBU206391 TaxID=2731692 RepID=UPI00165037DA|nr:hypothetical protein [Actinomadura sp. HBU206391]MBC6460005.1 hypothetical protein [Actinomadura sp. HBU206391]